MNVVSTITNEGKVRFMTYRSTMTAVVFITFLGQLVQGAHKKMLLIVDPLPAHTSAGVEQWLQGREDRIEMFFLPAHSPERNPDEYLNNDIHHSVNAANRTVGPPGQSLANLAGEKQSKNRENTDNTQQREASLGARGRQ